MSRVWDRDHRGPPIIDRVSWDDLNQPNTSSQSERTARCGEDQARVGAQQTKGNFENVQ